MSGINSVTGRADISQVLAEMRNIRAQIQPAEQLKPEVSPTQINPTNKVDEIPKFSDLLSNAVNSVNDAQQKSSALQTAYSQGDPNVSITQVMIQSQKASVAFEAVTQVRNKVVKAYEDIMKMPV
ncbi:flagellar hook-basal body protein FliE [Oleiphilus sp. HI0009]|uniref:flagellar hook-basal body complex protein FliE n=1 Tax=unclassified Oleiphilus TaxID=2631174 RepID=UPI0007C2C5A0|nr:MULTISPECIES: flagellar hook-basal body complex protein FliE [unclassified Oleiphilus]KZX72419.1 flagellar hook-basal body protein FliE [Oleiphilus sp. HI0009]KZX76971.1 flagellar hook-basal body protein FliE [Oleiphilus sp. HI0009]KZY66134.1 flagellar hook-basal body protein FliE [Oleiphilus sp. HI0066]KZY71173.1 flagellar hook-basal body protein FliE [Oleiphilus sp. HI0067]KZY76263.1 flagellar hook-basal body protein FliE [Oleiphilus sp. HI0067]